MHDGHLPDSVLREKNNEPQQEPEKEEPKAKPFWKSKTFWCLAVAAVLVIFDFGADDVTAKLEEIATLATLIGAFVGRMDAQGPMAIGSFTLPKRG